jgi:hypothetical protein
MTPVHTLPCYFLLEQKIEIPKNLLSNVNKILLLNTQAIELRPWIAFMLDTDVPSCWLDISPQLFSLPKDILG